MLDISPLSLQFLISLFSPIFEKDLLSSIIGATVGAILAFGFSAFLQKRIERKARALNIIQEYSSPEFIDIRNDAGQAIRNIQQTSLIPSWENLFDHYKDSNNNEWRKISKIKHFYEKLNFLVKINEVHLTYINSYFYAEFTHWNKKYFLEINGASGFKELDVSTLEKKLQDPRSHGKIFGFIFRK